MPSTKVTVVNDFTRLIGNAHAVFAVSAKGTSPDLSTTYIVNNKSINSPLNNVMAPLAQIPAGNPATDPSVTWFDTATGTTSPLTVPKDASGDILVDGPSKFTIQSQLSSSADGSNSFPTVLACTAPAGEDLTMAHIQVIPTGSQNVDATMNYGCDIWPGVSSVPTDGTAPVYVGQQMTNEIAATLPSAVAPGGTIASTAVTDNWEMPLQIAGTLIDFNLLVPQAGVDGSLPGESLGVGIDGQSSTSALNDMTTPSTPYPTAAPWVLNAAGTSSAISVPAGTTSDVTLSAPQRLTIEFNVEPTDPTAAPSPWVMQCTANDGQDLTLATIDVIQPPAHSALTATGPRSSVYGTAVTVPVGVTVPAVTPKPVQAGGTQSVDTTEWYDCSTWKNTTTVPTDGTAPNNVNRIVNSEFTFTLPASVKPGSTIPAGDASLTWRVPNEDFADPGPGYFNVADTAGVDKVNLPGAALGVSVNGQNLTTSPLTLANSALTPVPAGVTNSGGGYWPVEADGTTSAITVPANATGELTIRAPQQFEIDYTAEPNDAGTAAGITPMPVAMQCQKADGLTLASIKVITPPTPAKTAVPTGKVLITTAAGKGVAQGTIVKGKANVVIPGTALPVGKSTLTVKYTGDSNTLAAPAKTITVVKTKATPSLAVHVTRARLPPGRSSRP